MAVVTICSDFGAQEKKNWLFPLFHNLFPWSDNLPVLFSNRSSMSLGSKNEDLGIWGGDIFLPSQQSCLPLCLLVCSPFNFQFQLKCLFHSAHWNDVPTSRKNQLHSFCVSSSLWPYFEFYRCFIPFAVFALFTHRSPLLSSKLVHAAGSQFTGPNVELPPII